MQKYALRNHSFAGGTMTGKLRLGLTLGWLILITTACGRTPAATPDTQATIDAAIAATGAAHAAQQAAIDAAVQATVTAQAISLATPTAAQSTNQAVAELTPTPAIQASDATLPAPVPAPETVTMSEEELAALIDQAVTEAILATTQYSDAAAEAAADNVVTPEEVQTVEIYVSGAEEAIALAEELLNSYAALYGDLATETIVALEEMNQSLQELTELAAAMNVTLAQINSTLAQGVTLAEETIAQLESAAQAASAKADAVQSQLQSWAATRPAHLAQLNPAAPAAGPGQPTDPQAAIQSAFEFVQAGQQALADGSISPEELTSLAQLGANAGAVLNAQQAAQLQQLAGSVNAANQLLAQGNLAELQPALTQLGVDSALAIPPNQVAGDLPGSLQMALSFVANGQQAMADQNISAAEFAALAQLGANARAGLEAHGGPQMQQLTGSIDDITAQIARGNLNDAGGALNQFGNSLDSPPDIEKPTLPDKPARPRN